MCLDERSHGVSSLAYAKLAGFQGASLLVHNDSVFRESDFESISRIGDSVKRTQVGKTGRFGVGFNSVYHLTDMPGFVSGRHVVFFDPHCAFLPNVSASNPGKRIDFVKNDVLTAHPDQFEPFRAFGCDMRAEYRGTTFRFPLRTPEQASLSKLSKASYDANGVRALRRDREGSRARRGVLQNVEVVDVLEWAPGTRSRTRRANRPTLADRGAQNGGSSRAPDRVRDEPIEPPTVFEATFESAARRPAGDSSNDLGAPPPAEGPRGERSSCRRRSGAPRWTRSCGPGGKFGMKLVPWASVAAEIGGPRRAGLRGRVLFSSAPGAHGPPRARERVLRAELEPARHLVRGGHGRRRRGAERVESVCLAAAPPRTLGFGARGGDAGTAACLAVAPRGRPPEPWGGVVRATCAAIVDLGCCTRARTAGGGSRPARRRSRTPKSSGTRARGGAGPRASPSPTRRPGALVPRRTRRPAGRAPSRHPRGRSRFARGNRRGAPPRARALTLLEYCLSDIVDEDAAGSAATLEVCPRPARRRVARRRSRGGAPGAALMIVPASVEEVRLMRNAGDLRVVKTTGDEGGRRMKARGA